jgi:hypothetical protein
MKRSTALRIIRQTKADPVRRLVDRDGHLIAHFRRYESCWPGRLIVRAHRRLNRFWLPELDRNNTK